MASRQTSTHSKPRPSTASTARPSSAVSGGPTRPATEEQLSRVRILAAQSTKFSNTEREAVLSVLKSVETLQKRMDQRTTELAESRQQHQRDAERFEEMQREIADLQRQCAEYNKLDAVRECLSVESLEESLEDMNATCSRYGLPPIDFYTGGAGDMRVALDPAAAGSPRRGGSASVSHVSLGESGEALKMHVLRLIQDRFRGYEQMVFGLKKKVIRAENDEELIETMRRFGSVSQMLESARTLQTENERLRLREQRYDPDPLLRRRACPRDSPSAQAELPVLLMALQNELGHARAVIAAYNMEPPPPEATSAEDAAEEAPNFLLLADVLGAGEGHAGAAPRSALKGRRAAEAEAEAPQHPGTEHELLHRLNTLEYSNGTMRQKVVRMEEERALQAMFLDVTALGAEGEGAETQAVKEKKVARLTRLNAALLAQNAGWESAMQAKEDTIVTLNQIVEYQNTQQARLAEDFAAATDKAVSLRAEVAAARKALAVQDARLQGMCDLAQLLAHATLPPEDLPREQRGAFAACLFRDVLRARARLARAGLRIQRLFRGHLGRKIFVREGRRAGGIGLPLAWHAAVGAHAAGRTPSSLTMLARGGAARPADSLLAPIAPLCRCLVALPGASAQLLDTLSLVHLAGLQVKRKLAAPVADELRAFGDTLAQTSASILSAFEQRFPRTYDDATQAGPPLGAVPHYLPVADPDRPRAPWIGAWALSPPDLDKLVPTVKDVQTPATEEEWAAVEQPVWQRPGLGAAE